MSFNILLCPQLSKPEEDFCMARGYRNEAFQELSEGIVHGSGEESHFKLVTFFVKHSAFAPGD